MTDKKTEALKLALVKIRAAQMCHPNAVMVLIDEAEEVLAEALAEQPVIKQDLTPEQPAQQQEPVAWRTFDGEGGYEFRDYEMNEDYGDWWAQTHPNHLNWVEPLYTAPPPRQPLTEEQPQRWAVFCGICHKQWSVPYQHPGKSVCDGCEAAHGIKGKA